MATQAPRPSSPYPPPRLRPGQQEAPRWSGLRQHRGRTPHAPAGSPPRFPEKHPCPRVTSPRTAAVRPALVAGAVRISVFEDDAEAGCRSTAYRLPVSEPAVVSSNNLVGPHRWARAGSGRRPSGSRQEPDSDLVGQLTSNILRPGAPRLARPLRLVRWPVGPVWAGVRHPAWSVTRAVALTLA